MATYLFRLDGCHDGDIAQVYAALGKLPKDVVWSIHRLDDGTYYLSVATDRPLAELLALLNAVLAPLGVTAVHVPSIIQDTQPKPPRPAGMR